jgi:undecaprenyl-diphosphatase
MTTPVVSGARARATSSRPDRAGEPDQPTLDLCVARPGGLAERVGTRLGRYHPAVAAGIVALAGYAALAALVVGFGHLFVDVVLPGAVNRWDHSVVRALVEGRPEWDTWSDVGTLLADALPVIVMAVAVLGIAFAKRWFAAAGVLFFALSTQGALYLTGSRAVPRNRPPVGQFEDLPVDTSYPSGHVAAALVLYVSIALLVWNATRNRFARAVACIPAILFPPLVAVSRMYRGMHNPTDVMAGYILGILCLVVAVFAVRVGGAVSDRRTARSERHTTS